MPKETVKALQNQSDFKEMFLKKWCHGLLSLWPQWLAGFEVWLLMTLLGVSLGWTSPFIGKLSRPSSPFKVSKDDITWVASLSSIGRIFGILLSLLTINYYGSKKTLYIPAVSFAFSCIFLAVAPSIDYVFVSYICNGVAMGSLYNTFPLFIGEIANKIIRGRLSSLVVQGFMFGYLSGNLIGTYLDLLSMGIICSVPTLIFLFTFHLFPDTPYALLKNNDSPRALKSIKWYNPYEDACKELVNLEGFLASNPISSLIDTFKKFKISVNRNTLILINLIYSVIQLNGFMAILEYMEVLFTEAKVNVVSPATMVTLISFVAVASSWISFVISDKFGRTTILSVSMLVISGSLFMWGLNYHLYDLGYTNHDLQWIAITAAIIFRFGLTLGYLPIVPTIISEIFAPDVKNLGSTISNITCALFTFISSKSFQYLLDTITLKYTFYLFGSISLFVAIYSKVYIPETKGKSLQEIQDILNKRYEKKSTEDDSKDVTTKL